MNSESPIEVPSEENKVAQNQHTPDQADAILVIEIRK